MTARKPHSLTIVELQHVQRDANRTAIVEDLISDGDIDHLMIGWPRQRWDQRRLEHDRRRIRCGDEDDLVVVGFTRGISVSNVMRRARAEPRADGCRAKATNVRA